MPAVADQVHGKFKMFVGELDEAHKPTSLMKQVEAFVKQGGIAPKSIGVEYLEDDKVAVLTLGYREARKGYPVKLSVKSLGKAEHLGPEGLAALEKKLAKAAAAKAGIICHELYVTEENEFLVIFMTAK